MLKLLSLFFVVTVKAADECALGIHTCNETTEDCLNTASSFICVCKDGYELDGTVCVDINECDGDNDCHANAICENTTGGYTCQCKSGFMGDGISTCDDFDECWFEPCDINANCTNYDGGFSCDCNEFYDGDGLTCSDADECTQGIHNCHNNAECTNKDMGFDCACSLGYAGDGITACNDVNECSTNDQALEHECDENAECINNIGSYSCICNTGYTMEDGTCSNINECELELDDCHEYADCNDLDGTFSCTCQSGFDGDGITCADIDECYNQAHNCDVFTEICANTNGGFDCTPIDCSDLRGATQVYCDYSGMQISIPKCVFENFNMADWYLDGPVVSTGENVASDCMVESYSTDDAWMNWKVNNEENSCNTIMDNNGTHISYQNAVQKSVDWGSNMVINRGTGIIMKFKCAYSLSQFLTLNSGITALTSLEEVILQTRAGHHYLTGGLYTDASFSTLLNPAATINTPDDLFMSVSMSSWDSSLNIILEQCWATPNSNPNHPQKYTFIDNFCPDTYELNVQQSINIFANGGEKKASFSLRSFNWQGEDTSQVYFHCLVAICDSDNSSCIPQCSNRKKRSSSSRSLLKTEKISVGPIQVKQNN